jgi:hypothetical protein
MTQRKFKQIRIYISEEEYSQLRSKLKDGEGSLTNLVRHILFGIPLAEKPPHGDKRLYWKGCRCRQCRDAANAWLRTHRAKKDSELQEFREWLAKRIIDENSQP